MALGGPDIRAHGRRRDRIGNERVAGRQLGKGRPVGIVGRRIGGRAGKREAAAGKLRPPGGKVAETRGGEADGIKPAVKFRRPIRLGRRVFDRGARRGLAEDGGDPLARRAGRDRTGERQARCRFLDAPHEGIGGREDIGRVGDDPHAPHPVDRLEAHQPVPRRGRRAVQRQVATIDGDRAPALAVGRERSGRPFGEIGLDVTRAGGERQDCADDHRRQTRQNAHAPVMHRCPRCRGAGVRSRPVSPMARPAPASDAPASSRPSFPFTTKTRGTEGGAASRRFDGRPTAGPRGARPRPRSCRKSLAQKAKPGGIAPAGNFDRFG